jgi:hypothetical protein
MKKNIAAAIEEEIQTEEFKLKNSKFQLSGTN